MRSFKHREAVLSDHRYGKYPGSRSIEELIKRGIVVIDKPKGPTSHQVTAWIKEILGIDKAGHTGTLDPKVTGVLVVALQKSTKTMPALKGLDKEYIALMLLHDDVGDEELLETVKKFRGRIKQVPPKKSAVKRRERTREIKKLELLERDGKKVLMKIKCEAGTYIRKLIHDMGEELGCGAHMKELRRTAVGPFEETEAVKLQTLKDNYIFSREDKNRDIRKNILPVEVVADISKCIIIKDTAIEAVCNGAELGTGGVSSVEEGIKKDDVVLLLSGKGELVAIGKARMDTKDIYTKNEGRAVTLINVIMERGTYPKAWK